MEQIERYLKDMKFKKAVFGGVDEEDVLLHIKEICKIYQTELEKSERLQASYNDLQAEIAIVRRDCEAWREKAENNNIQDIERVKHEYEQKYSELTAAVDTIQTVKKEAAVQAQVEAAQEAAKLRNEIMSKVEEERKTAESYIQKIRSEADMLSKYNSQMRENIELSLKKYNKSIDELICQLKDIKETVVAMPEAITDISEDISGEKNDK